MGSPQELLIHYKRKLLKALKHLEYSYKKTTHLLTDVENLDDEALEVWESFAARFSRVSDLFLTKYVRAKVLENDPGFEGTLRDFINQGEKLGILDNANEWMAVRELRNISAHDYSEEQLSEFFEKLRKASPHILSIKNKL
jgi:hypothetical protein